MGHVIFRLTRDSTGLLRGLERLLDRTLRGYVTATIPVTDFPFCHPVQIDVFIMAPPLWHVTLDGQWHAN